MDLWKPWSHGEEIYVLWTTNSILERLLAFLSVSVGNTKVNRHHHDYTRDTIHVVRFISIGVAS